MKDFMNVIKKDPQICLKINDMLDRYNTLPNNYLSNLRYDTLIQNVIHKELMNVMGTAITYQDIELKMKSSRMKYLESRLLKNDEYLYIY